LYIEEELISLIERLGLTDVHLVHVGAHLVEEFATYNNGLIKRVSWIEANPEHFLAAKSLLREYTNQEVFQAAIYSESGSTRMFYVASNDGMSSSLLKFDRHRGFFPNVRTQRKFKVNTVTLDDFLNINFPNQPCPEAIVLDIQGAELDALRGSQKTLESAKIVVSEISRYQMYRNQGLFEEINLFLEGYGYLCVCLNYETEFEYGDAIWVKRELSRVLDFNPITVVSNRNPRAGIFGNKFLLLDKLRLLEIGLRINQWIHSQQKEFKSVIPSQLLVVLTRLRRHFHELLLKREGIEHYSKYIQPEIVEDEFYDLINKYAGRSDLKSYLEIGSSSGQGSTKAIVEGILSKDSLNVSLHCLEISQVRFNKLHDYYSDYSFVKVHQLTSVPLTEYPSRKEVKTFYKNNLTNLNNQSLRTVMSWLKKDIDFLRNNSFGNLCGIEEIRESEGIDYFDFVLIDGGEFTGFSELMRVIGAKVILLDDVNSFKCYKARSYLMESDRYRLAYENLQLRNGFSVFERVNHAL